MTAAGGRTLAEPGRRRDPCAGGRARRCELGGVGAPRGALHRRRGARRRRRRRAARRRGAGRGGGGAGHGGAPGGGGAAAVHLRPLALPRARPAGRRPCPDSAARDRAGGRGGARRGARPAWLRGVGARCAAWSSSTPGRAAAPSRWRWRRSSVPAWCGRCGPPTCSAGRARGGGGQPAACLRRRCVTGCPTSPGAGELAGPAARSAARPRRPGGLEPALRHRGGVGRAGPRGAGRAPAGAGGRPGPGRCAGAGRRGGRARKRRAPGWAGPGTVVVELAPAAGRGGAGTGPGNWGTTR